MRVSLRHFLDASALPTPPATFDYTPASQLIHRVLANDSLGDCVPAGGYHFLGIATANAGAEYLATDTEVIHDYSKIGGYNGRPSTDNGCNEQDALHYWQTTGFTNGAKILGWLTVDNTDLDLSAKICYTFEHLMYGEGIPDSWLNVNGDEFVWDAARSNPNNGHCYFTFGHSRKGFRASTWGHVGWLTDRAHVQNTDECYVMLTEAIVNKVNQKAPNAIDWPGIVTYWNSIGGKLPEPPAPMSNDWSTL
jgi:hypothetical protein